jgi:hypothetical protein
MGRHITCLSLSVIGVTAATSLLPYDFRAYNALLDYKVARVYARDDGAIASLGDVFMSHRVNDTFGLCLLHNHFKLRADELMVETVFRYHKFGLHD